MLTDRIELHHVISPTDDRRHGAPRRARLALVLAVLIALPVGTLWAVGRAAPAPSTVTSSAASPTGLVLSLGQRPSHNGLYSAEVISASPMAIGVRQSWTVHLSRRTHQLSHAAVKADAWMPDSPSDSPIKPSVRYVGSGNYRLDNVNFPRPGWWNVALVIDGRYGTDSVAFNVILPEP